MLLRAFSTLTLFSTLILAQGIDSSEEVLSKDNLKLFELNEEQNRQNSLKLEKDWINAITYSFDKSYSDTYDTTKSVIAINQPIFKSGGIYKAIRYANSLGEYNQLDIKQQKIELIKDAYTLLFQIAKSDLSIKKQELLIKNAQIDVNIKKEQVLNGLLDTSFLDNSILDLNTKRNSLSELVYNKESLINSFHNISNQDYKSFELPKLKIFSKESFLKKSLELQKQDLDIKTKENYKGMIISKYLPSINANYNYTKYHSSNNPSLGDDTYTYGLSLTVPIDIKGFNEIESTKLEFLKTKTTSSIKKRAEANYYRDIVSKLEMLDMKIELNKNDYALYDSLVKQMEELKKAEFKTSLDVELLKNSKEIKVYEIKSLSLDRQIELLNLYAKILR